MKLLSLLLSLGLLFAPLQARAARDVLAWTNVADMGNYTQSQLTGLVVWLGDVNFFQPMSLAQIEAAVPQVPQNKQVYVSFWSIHDNTHWCVWTDSTCWLTFLGNMNKLRQVAQTRGIDGVLVDAEWYSSPYVGWTDGATAEQVALYPERATHWGNQLGLIFQGSGMTLGNYAPWNTVAYSKTYANFWKAVDLKTPCVMLWEDGYVYPPGTPIAWIPNSIINKTGAKPVRGYSWDNVTVPATTGNVWLYGYQ